MNRWLTIPAILCVVAASVALGFCISLLNSPKRVEQPTPPVIGGQQVPNAMYEIRFDKRHDVHCIIFDRETTVFRGCKVLGFTGREEAAPATGGFSSGYGRFQKFMDQWLVLEHADGRRTYVPSGSLKYLEESDEKAENVEKVD